MRISDCSSDVCSSDLTSNVDARRLLMPWQPTPNDWGWPVHPGGVPCCIGLRKRLREIHPLLSFDAGGGMGRWDDLVVCVGDQPQVEYGRLAPSPGHYAMSFRFEPPDAAVGSVRPT